MLEDDGRVIRAQNAYSGRGRPPEKYELIDDELIYGAFKKEKHDYTCRRMGSLPVYQR